MTNSTVKPKRGSGRPAISDAQRAEMRWQIAQAAKHLFQTEGYSHISIRRIAGEVGCSPMSLYKYYDAKIDILRTLWGDVFVEVFDALDRLEITDLPPIKQLQALAYGYVEYWLTYSEHYRLVFMAEGVSQAEVSIFIDNPELVSRYQLFARCIMQAADKELPFEEVKTRLDALICFLHGIAHNLITMNGYDWASADALVSLAVEGVTVS